MSGSDLIILIFYLLCLAYIVQKIIQEIDSLAIIEFNQQLIKTQLEQQNLDNILKLEFILPEQLQLNNFQDLTLKLTNSSENQSFCLDWVQTTITDFTGKSRRVIRIIPGLTLDLFQPQIYSVVAPKQILETKLTAEDTLQRNQEGSLEIVAPLFEAKKLKEALDKRQKFYLYLVFKSTNYLPDNQNQFYLLSVEFTVKKMSWRKALYWQKKKKT